MSAKNSPSPSAAHLSSVATVLQVSSSDWLKVYGLSCQGLTLDQLLPKLGFQQKQGSINGKKVTSQYGDGLFTQHPNSTGKVYNVCHLEQLEPVKNKLQEAVDQLKARYDWLTSGSRLTFGVVYGRRVVMVLDSCITKDVQLKPYLNVAADVITDQFHHVDQFNLIRCCNGVESWREDLVSSGDDTLADALEWVGETTPQDPVVKNSVVEAINQARSYSNVDSVYLFSQGEASLRAFDSLLEKLKATSPGDTDSSPPVHIVVYDCGSAQAMEKYKQLASASGAKCHFYKPPRLAKGNPLLSSCSSLSSQNSPPLSAHSRTGSRHGSSSSRPLSAHSQTGSGHGSRPQSGRTGSSSSRPSSAQSLTPKPSHHPSNEDAALVWDELDKARDVLAEIQALHLEVTANSIDDSTCNSNSEDYMTSKQWLQSHGLKCNKLMFGNFVSSLAFLHCNGVVKMIQPARHRETGCIEMVPHSKLVQAKYCKDFVHIRLHKEGVVHIQLSDHAHRVYCEKVKELIGVCQSRLEWLKSGSREIYGTLLENKVIMVIDSSSSMGERFKLVKDKTQQLIQEQLCEKEEFTLLHFNSTVEMWRDELVPTSEENLQAASEWVQELKPKGSSNTMYALIKALSVPDVEAVYLLTDGRPDQEVEEVMKEVENLPKLPVHTISFNCADSQANHFLAELSSRTGGRYHYFSEDVSDPEGPKTYQGEDIEALENEIKLALEQMAKADELLKECQAVRKKQARKKQSKTHDNAVKKSGNPSVVKRSSSSAVAFGSISDIDSSGRPKKAKVLMSSKKWLEKNSLSALNLSLMDALGPSSIPHSAKHVSLLDKHVTSKVFNDLFPLAHVTKGQKVTLINPLGVNLPEYEKKLEKQVEIYWNRLTRLALSVIPQDKREAVREKCGVSDDSEVLYQQHREILREVLEELGWPRPQKDFDLLEKEIQQAEEYKQYSVSLREEASQPRREERARFPSRASTSLHSVGTGDTSIGLYSATSAESLVELMDQLQLHNITPSPPPKGTRTKVNSKLATLKSQKVIARSKEDGFYYPGVVVGHTDSRHAIVQLVDGEKVPTLIKHVLPVGGAGPCPVLQVGNYVLVRVRTHHGPHPARDGSCDYYIPGIVQVLPEDSRKGHALHSVLVFNGRTVTCSRRGIVKITSSVYSAACKFIRARLPANEMQTSTGSHSHSRTVSHSYSGSEYGSSRSQSRTSIHIPSVSSQYNSDEETHSRTRSQSQSPEHRASSLPTEFQSLLEQQKSQGELLEKYRNDMDALSHRQLELEERLSKQNHDDFFTDNPQLAQSSDNIPPPPNTANSMTAGVNTGPAVCDQGVNTGPWMEDKGVGTEPLMESRCVGTNQTDTEAEVVEEDNDLLDGGSDEHLSSSPHTPTPMSPLQSATQSPEQPNIHTSSPSHGTPSPSHEPIETPQPTPAHERVDTPQGTPSHHPTPHSTPSHQSTLSHHHTSHSTQTPSKTNPMPAESLPLSNHIADLSYFEEEDPLVDQEVLARWPDDGWYYRGVVVRPVGQLHYQVEDATNDLETIHMADIITDLQDAQKPFLLGDTVAALHPHYPFSYAPGKIVGVAESGLHFTVQFYDGAQTSLSRQDVYHLAMAKHHSDVEYIEMKEKAWVGQAVIARNDNDGLYYPGKVVKQVERRWYLIKWANGSTQEQEAVHMYGQLTKRRPLRTGDKVLALAQQRQGIFMPGEIQGVQDSQLVIEFCDGKQDPVEPTHCFWVTGDYYQSAVEYIGSNVSVTPSPSLSTLSEMTNEQSEYSASYF